MDRVLLGKTYEKRIEVSIKACEPRLHIMKELVWIFRSVQCVREGRRLVGEEGAKVLRSERGLYAEQLWSSRMACLVKQRSVQAKLLGLANFNF